MIVVNVVKMTALFNMFKVTKMTGLMIVVNVVKMAGLVVSVNVIKNAIGFRGKTAVILRQPGRALTGRELSQRNRKRD